MKDRFSVRIARWSSELLEKHSATSSLLGNRATPHERCAKNSVHWFSSYESIKELLHCKWDPRSMKRHRHALWETITRDRMPHKVVTNPEIIVRHDGVRSYQEPLETDDMIFLRQASKSSSKIIL